MPMEKLSPRQRDCLQLVWERQATSKEIAIALGISKSTVDGYISEAIVVLGARDRRAAAALAFGQTPRATPGGQLTRVACGSDGVPSGPVSTEGFLASRPWRSPSQPRNTLSFAQTLGWIAIIAIGSLAALSLAASIGSGLPSVAKPVIHAVRTLTN